MTKTTTYTNKQRPHMTEDRIFVCLSLTYRRSYRKAEEDGHSNISGLYDSHWKKKESLLWCLLLWGRIVRDRSGGQAEPPPLRLSKLLQIEVFSKPTHSSMKYHFWNQHTVCLKVCKDVCKTCSPPCSCCQHILHKNVRGQSHWLYPLCLLPLSVWFCHSILLIFPLVESQALHAWKVPDDVIEVISTNHSLFLANQFFFLTSEMLTVERTPPT